MTLDKKKDKDKFNIEIRMFTSRVGLCRTREVLFVCLPVCVCVCVRVCPALVH